MPQQQNKMAPVRGETTVPRHHNEPLITSHKNRDSENHHSEFLAKVRKMAKKKYFHAGTNGAQSFPFANTTLYPGNNIKTPIKKQLKISKEEFLYHNLIFQFLKKKSFLFRNEL